MDVAYLLRGDQRADRDAFANPVLDVDLQVWPDTLEVDEGGQDRGHGDAAELDQGADGGGESQTLELKRHPRGGPDHSACDCEDDGVEEVVCAPPEVRLGCATREVGSGHTKDAILNLHVDHLDDAPVVCGGIDLAS